MAKTQYSYLIAFNDISTEGYRFDYTYKQIHISVVVSKDSFLISYTTGAQKSFDAIWNSDLIDDATRKCMTAQLILFGQNPAFQKAILMDAETKDSQTFTTPRIYSLFKSECKVNLSVFQDRSFIQDYIFNMVQSKFESGIASMFSYIFAKTRTTEEEKFTYYWRAFNGIYSSLADEVKYNGNSSLDLTKEWAMLLNWLEDNDLSNETVSHLFDMKLPNDATYDVVNKRFRYFGYTIRDKVSKAVWTKKEVIDALNGPGNRNANLANILGLNGYLPDFDKDKMIVTIEKGHTVIANVSLYGFLMAELAYQMRCDYFHARKPILLYSSVTNPAYRSLELVNILIEHYLDHHIKEEIIKKIELEKKKEKREPYNNIQ